MATVTVTETGVVVTVQMSRDEVGVDRVFAGGTSITNVPQVNGRRQEPVELTDLTVDQKAIVKSVLDFIAARLKTLWNIP